MIVPFGQPVTLTFDTYSDAAQTTPADPTTVSLDLRAPDGTETTHIWPGGDITRAALGVFTYTTPATEVPGLYDGHFDATGSATTSKDVSFRVEPKYGTLATPDDLAVMWRPLLDSELDRAQDLLGRASALLRQAMPHLDARIAAFRADPTDTTGIDPINAATVVATIVKRFISNVEGIASQSVGPYSVSYALRSEKEVRGELQVTANDLRALAPYRPKQRLGSIRVRPGLAPPPYGDLGVNIGVVASLSYDSLAVGTGAFPVESPTVIGLE